MSWEVGLNRDIGWASPGTGGWLWSPCQPVEKGVLAVSPPTETYLPTPPSPTSVALPQLHICVAPEL